jgi:hypothetical protein
MNDVNVVFALLLFLAAVGLMRSRGMGRRQRELKETIAHLQSAQAAAAPVLPGASKEQMERLEARVRVLERIVTDRGYDVATQIEALRDPRPRQPELEEGDA